MKNNTKTILVALATTLLCAAAAKAQNYSQNYNQNGTYTCANGRTTSYNNNQSYTAGAGGWMGTGCPQGVGWTIFAINAIRGSASGQPIPTPTSMGGGYGSAGGYYGGGGGGYYGGGGCGGYYQGGSQCGTYRAGWGVTPY